LSLRYQARDDEPSIGNYPQPMWAPTAYSVASAFAFGSVGPRSPVEMVADSRSDICAILSHSSEKRTHSLEFPADIAVRRHLSEALRHCSGSDRAMTIPVRRNAKAAALGLLAPFRNPRPDHSRIRATLGNQFGVGSRCAGRCLDDDASASRGAGLDPDGSPTGENAVARRVGLDPSLRTPLDRRAQNDSLVLSTRRLERGRKFNLPTSRTCRPRRRP